MYTATNGRCNELGISPLDILKSMSDPQSPNMGLWLPVYGTSTWQSQFNEIVSNFSTVDAHTHVSGSGVPITTAAMSINSDLTFNAYNVSDARSVRFFNNPSTLSGGGDVASAYVFNGNLWFNTSTGQQVQLTNNGGLATNGSVAIYVPTTVASNMTIPSNAAYNALLVDTSSSRTITLPVASTQSAGKSFYIKDIGQTGVNTITLAVQSTNTLEKTTSPIVLSQPGMAVMVMSDGSNGWWLFYECQEDRVRGNVEFLKNVTVDGTINLLGITTLANQLLNESSMIGVGSSIGAAATSLPSIQIDAGGNLVLVRGGTETVETGCSLNCADGSTVNLVGTNTISGHTTIDLNPGDTFNVGSGVNSTFNSPIVANDGILSSNDITVQSSGSINLMATAGIVTVDGETVLVGRTDTMGVTIDAAYVGKTGTITVGTNNTGVVTLQPYTAINLQSKNISIGENNSAINIGNNSNATITIGGDTTNTTTINGHVVLGTNTTVTPIGLLTTPDLVVGNGTNGASMTQYIATINPSSSAYVSAPSVELQATGGTPANITLTPGNVLINGTVAINSGISMNNGSSISCGGANGSTGTVQNGCKTLSLSDFSSGTYSNPSNAMNFVMTQNPLSDLTIIVPNIAGGPFTLAITFSYTSSFAIYFKTASGVPKTAIHAGETSTNGYICDGANNLYIIYGPG